MSDTISTQSKNLAKITQYTISTQSKKLPEVAELTSSIKRLIDNVALYVGSEEELKRELAGAINDSTWLG